MPYRYVIDEKMLTEIISMLRNCREVIDVIIQTGNNMGYNPRTFPELSKKLTSMIAKLEDIL